MSNTPVLVAYHLGVAEVISQSAVAAAPRETGGLLLGWWEPSMLVIRQAIEVIDPSATDSSWSRIEHTAQKALDRTLDRLDQRCLGYVGDWHTHPSACPPSNTDITSIRLASQQFAEPLALLVHAPGDILSLRVAHHGRLRRAYLQRLDPERTR